MAALLIVYIITAVMISSILFMATSDVFPLMNRTTKIASIFVETIVGILWFPALIYITAWTLVKKIRS